MPADISSASRPDQGSIEMALYRKVRMIILWRCIAVFAFAACGSSCSDHGVHESQLVLKESRDVVPLEAHRRDGSPFNGTAYGTFFGERSFDAVEWTGPFKDGLPDGEFLIFSGTQSEPLLKITYARGTRVSTLVLER
jgi:hypothetical protein